MEETTMRKVQDLPQCPFWRELAGNRIGCEGITPHSTLCLQFTSRAERQQQEAVFCCKHYSKCELYRRSSRPSIPVTWTGRWIRARWERCEGGLPGAAAGPADLLLPLPHLRGRAVCGGVSDPGRRNSRVRPVPAVAPPGGGRHRVARSLG